MKFDYNIYILAYIYIYTIYILAYIIGNDLMYKIISNPFNEICNKELNHLLDSQRLPELLTTNVEDNFSKIYLIFCWSERNRCILFIVYSCCLYLVSSKYFKTTLTELQSLSLYIHNKN